MKKRVFSAVQPTGVLHIGNYLGAIKNWLELQDQYNCIFSVVDLHALTVPQDPKVLKAKTMEIVNLYLACGLDPKKCLIFIQSHVPYHTELTWLLNCLTYYGELQRMTQFKEKARGKGETVSVGLFDYPVLMAADILLYQTELVPVGADQKQHVELARDLAERFNNRFGAVFTVPEVQIKEVGARIKALDDPTKKMSKTAESIYNYIALTDPPDLIRKKIKRAVTDSGTEVRSGPDKPALTNLLTIYSLFTGQPIPKLEEQYKGKGYADFKFDLAEVLVEALKPIQEKYFALQESPGQVQVLLKEAAEQAKLIAGKTVALVKEKMGLVKL